MNIICTSPSFAKYDRQPIKQLQDVGLKLIMLPADIGLKELEPYLADTVAMIVAFTEVNAELLAAAPQLKIVCKHGVGVDNIDLGVTREKGIYVTNVPDANKHAVADFAFSLILNCARQLPSAIEQTRTGNWPRIFASDVYGKTIGIIGLGNIGKQVALRARGFNMRVLAHDAWQDKSFAKANCIEYVSIDTLTENSDFITLHTPLTPETKNLFDFARMQKMKKSSYLINVSRGGVVNEEDLFQALTQGVIKGAAADVFIQEPCNAHPLFALENFIPTAHIAGYTEGAVSNIGEQCVHNIIACVIHKQKPQNIMNSL